MKLLSGDETGLLKLTDIEENKVITTMGEQQKDCVVQKILKLGDDYAVGGYSNGVIKLFDCNDGSLVFETALAENQGIIGMSITGEKNNIVACQPNGNVSLVEVGWNGDIPYLDDPIVLCNQVSKNPQNAKVNPFKTNAFMVLSKDVNPLVFDVNSKNTVWKGKNLPNDYLDLQVPIHDLDCTFRDVNSVFISTAHRKVRLYDLRQSNTRPTVDHLLKNEKFPLNHISMSSCGSYLYVSDTAGSVFVLDHRKDMHQVGKMKGATGSIRDLAVSAASPYAATVSLDRFLRVYNTNTYSMVRKVFLNQKLSAISFFEDDLDTDKLEECDEAKANAKQVRTQNDIAKAAKETRSQVKKNKIKLAFQRKTKNQDEDAEDEE